MFLPRPRYSTTDGPLPLDCVYVMVRGGTDNGQGGPEEHSGQNLLTITGREAEGRGEKKKDGGGGRGRRAFGPENATSSSKKILVARARRIRSRSAWRVTGFAPWGSTDISTCG